jgi:putative inorganic carbon (HCO3(-)) transporter
MRDILITAIVFGSLPFILKSPAIGSLMWVWISVMNPHTQGWGFATQFPFAMVIAITTLFSTLITREKKNIPLTSTSVIFIFFTLWMNVTMVMGIFPESSVQQWEKVMKIMLMTLVVLVTIRTKKDIQRLVAVITFSIGYYGVKGGIFTIRSGGNEKVWGPEGTFIGDNNSIALALILVIPLMYYLQQNRKEKWLRYALTIAMLLCALAALGSYSRGALLAIAAMLILIWLKSSKKFAIGVITMTASPLFLIFMPQGWSSRMDTIADYQTDGSAQGRINAWRMAYNLANDRFFGGGFEIYNPFVFSLYAPNPSGIHAAHSIYFQILGEHGFIGLLLYLILWILTWRSAAWIIRNTKNLEQMHWAHSLATMIQASIISFAVGGAFLSLAYFDVPYYLIVTIIATRIVVEKELQQTVCNKVENSMATPSVTSEARA